MGSIVAVVVSLVIAGALCVSAVRFWSESRLGAESVRRLAALSAFVTLLVVLMIYSGEFRKNGLLALQRVHAHPSLYGHVSDFLTGFDHVFTRVANTLNVFTRDVGYRPNPPLWPAILLLLSYSVRFLIYRLHTRKQHAEAALTGAVYWTHITAYAMVVAFFIVIVGWSAWLVIPLSLVVVVAFLVSVRLIVEDLGELVRVGLQSGWTLLIQAGRWIAEAATEIAAFVRAMLKYASKAYLEHIREPLRRITQALETRNRTIREDSERRLKAQDTRQRERFGETARMRRQGRKTSGGDAGGPGEK
ncbi:MAG: hypothetical protein ACLPZR_10740 [Solirubrobacteraceae bacterium]|jgi:hypothetical protein